MPLIHEVPPNSDMVLTCCKTTRPSCPSIDDDCHTYHPLRTVCMSGVATPECANLPKHRTLRPGKGILRNLSVGAQPTRLPSAPTHKGGPRFAHLAAFHMYCSDSPPPYETEYSIKTILPPGPVSKATASGSKVREAPTDRANDIASSRLNHLYQQGPMAKSYASAGGPQSQGMFDAAEPASDPSGSAPSEHPAFSNALFEKIGLRPPTPPLASSATEAQEVESGELEMVLPQETTQTSTPSDASSLDGEVQLPGPSTVDEATGTGKGKGKQPDLPPPPYSMLAADQSPGGEGQAAGTALESQTSITTASSDPMTATSSDPPSTSTLSRPSTSTSTSFGASGSRTPAAKTITK